jgi:nucleoid-associated protein YgaU
VSHYQGVIMKQLPWLVLLSFVLVGCSGSKSAQTVSEETPQIELSDADEFIENPNETPAAGDALAEQPAEGAELTEEPQVAVMDDPSVETADPMGAADASSEPVVASEPSSSMSGTQKTYTVQKNETLMLIAFKLYGDYDKWKELATDNRESLKGNTALREGMQLTYNAPAEEFVWNPQGLPYLIRTGDTLGGISGNVYGTRQKWKMIWDNNRPLIKDPNRIFAGFTIYYLENGREVATEL